jgi:type IV pilus assembly protein PilV
MHYLSRSFKLKRRTTKGRQQGVALIEVMVSLLIFSLGVLGLVAMQGKAITYTVDAENRSRAALLASEIVASMWLEGTTSPTTLTTWEGRVTDATVSGLPNAKADVSVPDANGVTKVTITWRAPSKASNENSSYFTQVVIP